MAKDWTKLYKNYKGLWVALGKDETTVLASGSTVKEVLLKAQKKTSDTPFLTRVPDTLNAYVGVL